MGQRGTKEQLFVLKEVICLYESEDKKLDLVHLQQVLQRFCQAFPLYAAVASMETCDASSDKVSFMQHEIREKKVLQCIPYFLNWRLGNVVQDRSLLDSMVVVLLECLKRIVLSKSFYLHVSTSKLVTSLYRCLKLHPQCVCHTLEVIFCLVHQQNAASVQFDNMAEKMVLQTSSMHDIGRGGVRKQEHINHLYFAEQFGYEKLGEVLSTNIEPLDMPNRPPNHITKMLLCIFQASLLYYDGSSCTKYRKQILHILFLKRLELLSICRSRDIALRCDGMIFIKDVLYRSSVNFIRHFQDDARNTGTILWVLQDALDNPKLYEVVEILAAASKVTRTMFSKVFPHSLVLLCEQNFVLSAVPRRHRPSITKMIFSREAITETILREKFPGFQWIKDIRKKGELWVQFMAAIQQTHFEPDLIWNRLHRSELRKALRDEIANMKAQRPDNIELNWEFESFQVRYQATLDELVVNGYYLRALLPKLLKFDADFHLDAPTNFAWHLHDRIGAFDYGDPTVADTIIRCLIAMRLLLFQYPLIFGGNMPFHQIRRTLQMKSSIEIHIQCLMLATTAINTSYSDVVSNSYVELGAIELALTLMSSSPEYEDTTRKTSYVHNIYDQHLNEYAQTRDEDRRSITSRLLESGLLFVRVLLQRSSYFVHENRSAQWIAIYLEIICLHKDSIDGPNIDLYLELLDNLLSKRPAACQQLLQARNFVALILYIASKASNDCDCICLRMSMVKFLSRYYLLTRDKAFQNYLPPCMLALLEKTMHTEFLTIFNHQSSLYGDIYWTVSMKKFLHGFLTSELLKSDISYSLKAKYDADDEFCVGDLFIRSFVHGNGKLLFQWPVEKWGDTIQSITSFVQSVESAEVEKCLVMQALYIIVQIRPEIRLSDLNMIVLAKELLQEPSLTTRSQQIKAFHMINVYCEVLASESINSNSLWLRQCKEVHFAILGVLRKTATLKFMEIEDSHKHQDLLSKSNFALTEKVVSILEYLISSGILILPVQYIPSIVFHVKMLQTTSGRVCILPFVEKYVVPDKHAQNLFFKLGGVLYLLLSIIQRSDDEKHCFSCLDVIAICYNMDCTPDLRIRSLLRVVLTPGVICYLKNRVYSTVLACLRQNGATIIQTPKLYWTRSMQKKLYSILKKMTLSLQTIGTWNVTEFTNHITSLAIYPELQQQRIVDDVFLSEFIQQNRFGHTNVDFINLDTFASVLLDLIKSTDTNQDECLTLALQLVKEKAYAINSSRKSPLTTGCTSTSTLSPCSSVPEDDEDYTV